MIGSGHFSGRRKLLQRKYMWAKEEEEKAYFQNFEKALGYFEWLGNLISVKYNLNIFTKSTDVEYLWNRFKPTNVRWNMRNTNDYPPEMFRNVFCGFIQVWQILLCLPVNSITHWFYCTLMTVLIAASACIDPRLQLAMISGHASHQQEIVNKSSLHNCLCCVFGCSIRGTSIRMFNLH